MNKKVTVHNDMQDGYTYELVEPKGKNFDPDFKPELTPKEMLELGVFGGHYSTITPKEFPKNWFTDTKLSDENDVTLNYFKVDASQPLSVWREKGWINEKHDPQGWFQWYCRYYMGRRLPEEDKRQIKRWRAMTRHVAQIKQNCKKGDKNCRRKQRQALLHWAYDSRKM